MERRIVAVHDENRPMRGSFGRSRTLDKRQCGGTELKRLAAHGDEQREVHRCIAVIVVDDNTSRRQVMRRVGVSGEVAVNRTGAAVVLRRMVVQMGVHERRHDGGCWHRERHDDRQRLTNHRAILIGVGGHFSRTPASGGRITLKCSGTRWPSASRIGITR